MLYVGQNVSVVTLKKQSDVVVKKILSTTGIVTLPSDKEALEVGQVLTTIDGGSNWNIQDKPIFTTGTYSQDDEVFHNGSIWISLEDNNQTEPKDDAIKWQEVEKFDANGILCESITQTGEAEVLLIGVVREKYLEGYDNSHKEFLFANRIILK